MSNRIRQITQNSIFRGTFILTCAGILTRLIGFYYRVFLANTIGTEGLGMYQLIFPASGLALAVCSLGIQTAISRYCTNRLEAARSLITGGLLSFFLSCGCAYIFYFCSDFIARRLLLNAGCAALLQILAFSLPFASVHNCVCGYYYGLKRTKVPALSQLFEQAIRVGVVYWIVLEKTAVNETPTAIVAVYGLVAGEIASFAFCILAMLFDKYVSFSDLTSSTSSRTQSLRQLICSLHTQLYRILRMAVPLSANRVLLGILQSAEAVLIPAQLVLYGCSSSEALSLYGILTGMALSFITFPATITHSASVLLLPSVSKAQASGKSEEIARAISSTLQLSLMMGIFCIGGFMVYGARFGALIFGNSSVYLFIIVLSWLCPFLYSSITLASIINGLGQTSITFLYSTVSLLIRIASIVLLIPAYGITGYLWGLLTSQIFLFFAYVIHLFRQYHYRFHVFYAVVAPTLVLLAALFLSLPVYFFLNHLQISALLTLPAGCGVAAAAYVLILYVYFDFYHQK